MNLVEFNLYQIRNAGVTVIEIVDSQIKAVKYLLDIQNSNLSTKEIDAEINIKMNYKKNYDATLWQKANRITVKEID